MNAVAPLALAALLSLIAPAHADDFYQGKTLTIVVGYSAGGGYDINARLVSRHIGNHLPGSPLSSWSTCRAPAACARSNISNATHRKTAPSSACSITRRSPTRC